MTTLSAPPPPVAVAASGSPSRLRVALTLVCAAATGGAAAPLIKITPLPPFRLAAGRLLLAALVLSPLAIVQARRAATVRAGEWWRRALVPGIALGLHFAAWNLGIGASRVADAALIGNLTPLATPFLLAVLAHERIRGREIAATAIAVGGLGLRWALNAWHPPAGADHAAGSMAGDAWCLVAMLFYAIYLTLARRHRALPSIWPYVAAVYTIGGLVCAGLSAIAEPWSRPTPAAWAGLAALIALPTLVSHSSFNWAMRHARGQVVSLCSALISPISAIIAWIAWGQPPGIAWLAAFVAVSTGLALAAWPRAATPPAPGR